MRRDVRRCDNGCDNGRDNAVTEPAEAVTTICDNNFLSHTLSHALSQAQRIEIHVIMQKV